MIRPDRKKEPSAPLVSRRLNDPTLPTQKVKQPSRRKIVDDPDLPYAAPLKQRAKPVSEAMTGERPNGTASSRSKAPRKAREMTEGRIRNIAMHYIERFECSEAMLREVLLRRLAKRLRELDPEKQPAERDKSTELIDAEVARLVSVGLVSDARFAENRARMGLQSKKGVRKIMMDLAQKGISQGVAEDAIREATRDVTGTIGRDDVDDAEVQRAAEWEAADAFARKKRFGPYRSQPMPEDWKAAQKIWQKEARSMVSRGFGFDMIRDILDREPDAPDV